MIKTGKKLGHIGDELTIVFKNILEGSRLQRVTRSEGFTNSLNLVSKRMNALLFKAVTEEYYVMRGDNLFYWKIEKNFIEILQMFFAAPTGAQMFFVVHAGDVDFKLVDTFRDLTKYTFHDALKYSEGSPKFRNRGGDTSINL